MKYNLILLFVVCTSFTVKAQNKYQLVDNFDDNRNGWTESVAKKSKAVIQEGVLLVESKNKEEYAFSLANLGVSLKENFELSCECNVKEITEEGAFGLIFNEQDEKNFCAVIVKKGTASLYEWRNGTPNLISSEKIKLSDKKEQTIQLSIKNEFGTLSFYVNGMQAISNVTGRINFSGFGFLAVGKQTAKFDNLKVLQ